MLVSFEVVYSLPTVLCS